MDLITLFNPVISGIALIVALISRKVDKGENIGAIRSNVDNLQSSMEPLRDYEVTKQRINVLENFQDNLKSQIT